MVGITFGVLFFITFTVGITFGVSYYNCCCYKRDNIIFLVENIERPKGGGRSQMMDPH